MSIHKITHTAVGTDLVRKLAEEGKRLFTAHEARSLAPSVGLSNGYVLQSLHYLAKSGWVVRLKKGLYALSGSVPGTTQLHEFEIAMALVKPAAISHWSALSHHQLTDQTPQRVFVLTTSRSVPHRRSAKPEGAKTGYPVGETAYQFIQIKPERFFGTEHVWVNESRIQITDPERTLLDGLMMPQYCGDVAEVLHAFELRAPTLDVERIIQYALKLDAATAKRLGWVLERQGIASGRLKPLQELPIKGYRVFDPSGPHHGPCDARWMIQVNVPGTGRS